MQFRRYACSQTNTKTNSLDAIAILHNLCWGEKEKGKGKRNNRRRYEARWEKEGKRRGSKETDGKEMRQNVTGGRKKWKKSK